VAISAKFAADFSDFQRGVTEANANLDKLSVTSERTAAHLAKMRGTATSNVLPFNNLRGSFQQFDGALRAVGVNISPQIAGLEDLGAAAGEGGKNMGLLAKAGLVVGAGMAAWGITRAAMEFFGLDKAVAQTWSTLLGYTDVGAAQAAAKTDVLARATKNAGREITNYTEAIQINEKAHQKAKGILEAPAKLAAYELALKAVVNEAGRLTAAQQATIVKALALGESTGEIAKNMSLSSGAVEVFVGQLKVFEGAAKTAADEAEKLAKLDAKSIEDTAALWREFGVEKIAMSGTETDARIADIHRWRDDEIAKLDERLDNYQQNKDAILAISKQQTEAQRIDFDFLRRTSIEGLQETAAQAQATYDEMLYGSRTFTREALEQQLQKTRDTAEAATTMGQSYTTAFGAITTGAQQATAAIVQMGGASNPTKPDGSPATAGQVPGTSGDKPGAGPKPITRGLWEFDPATVAKYRAMGLQDWQILNILLGLATEWDYPHTKAPARASGGGGASAGGSPGGTPSTGVLSGLTSGGTGGAVVIQNTFHVVDTEANIVRRVSDAITRSVLQGQKLGVR
jgi:hypothetical protein